MNGLDGIGRSGIFSSERCCVWISFLGNLVVSKGLCWMVFENHLFPWMEYVWILNLVTWDCWFEIRWYVAFLASTILIDGVNDGSIVLEYSSPCVCWKFRSIEDSVVESCVDSYSWNDRANCALGKWWSHLFDLDRRRNSVSFASVRDDLCFAVDSSLVCVSYECRWWFPSWHYMLICGEVQVCNSERMR